MLIWLNSGTCSCIFTGKIDDKKVYETSRYYRKESKITILLTRHLLDAAEEYDVGMERVLSALLFPDEVVRGHSGRFVAHKLLNDYMIRVVYEYEGGIPVVITLYIAKKKRYFRGGIYEDCKGIN